MNNEIIVSVICNTYNHERYIRDAIESFLVQKTDFLYEVLIHDDASTDKTAEIIKEYEKKYPELIKPIYQRENQYSKGINVSFKFQYPRAHGKYIAICEGDDYWIDPYKLQKQVNAMEQHPEVGICAHASIKISAETNNIIEDISPVNYDTIIPVKNVIFGEGGFVATSSLMHRATINKDVPRFRKNFILDYTLQIHGSLGGGMLYLSDFMSAYRWMSEGSWTSNQKDKQKRIELLEKKQIMLDELNIDTQKIFSSCIEKRKSRNLFEFYYGESDYKNAFSKKCYKGLKTYKTDRIIKFFVKAYFPRLVEILKNRSKQNDLSEK
ncbi:MAG: glycosyltransferase [Clostridiales bacterium]|nr:glycosyltransferase [Clostridiales bacterium]